MLSQPLLQLRVEKAEMRAEGSLISLTLPQELLVWDFHLLLGNNWISQKPTVSPSRVSVLTVNQSVLLSCSTDAVLYSNKAAEQKQ